QMLASLDLLAALPPETVVCCGHEYTVVNCAFARTLDPDNHALAEREMQAKLQRANGAPTLPVTIAQELACNPFLRVDSAAIVAAMTSDHPRDRLERFAALRQRKDEFQMPPAWMPPT
ncbi:MAG: hydroxyacylglutathione hydrolase C-terminal domain-containing protein, partial [Dokdonella sp.]